MAFRSLFAPWRSLSDRAKGAWLWIIDGVWKFTEWYADKSFGDDLFAWVRGKLNRVYFEKRSFSSSGSSRSLTERRSATAQGA
jgi:hypothetical protein